jgi:hypothetical protein
MLKSKTITPTKSALTIAIEPHSLEHHLAKDESFASAYLRVIGAIAASDGIVSLAEYSVVNDLVKQSDESAVAAVALLNALDRPSPLKVALSTLKTASSGIEISYRNAAFQAARPLLQLQGFESHDLAKQLAGALEYDLQKSELSDFPAESDRPLLKKLVQNSMRLVKGKELRNLAEMCLSVTGDASVSQSVVDFESGLIDKDELRLRLTTACAEVTVQIQSFKEQLQVAEFAASATTAYLQTAQNLKYQVAQRMAVMEARLHFERDTFSEDIDYTVHDAGNAFEVDVVDRLKTDQWKNDQVWESIGRTTFARELESRIKRVVSRREEMLRLLKEDLRLFQEELRITRVSILDQQHHTRFANLMPTLRPRTKVINGVDAAANVTLGGGVAVVAGAGAAVYFLSAAVVLPVIAPALPFVAVPVLLAGLFKWFSDPGARKDGEIRHKRGMFEGKLREQLVLAQTSFNLQLDQVALDFQKSAVQMIQPIMLEAEAADRLAGLQVKMAKRLIDQSSLTIGKVMQAIPQA